MLRGMAPEDQFALIAEQLNRIEDPGMKAAMAMKILGKSGQELIPMITELEELRRAANELGVTMTPENAAAAAALDDALDLLNRTFEGTRAAVGAAVAPLATDFLGALTAVSAAATDWVNRNQAVVSGVAILGAALVTAGTSLASFGSGLNAIIKMFESFVQYKAKIVTVLAALGGPGVVALGLVAATIGVIVAATVEWLSQQQAVNRAIEAAGKKQTIEDSDKLGQAETRFNQLSAKGKLTAAEQDEARSIANTLNTEYGKGTVSFNSSAGNFVDVDASKGRLSAARNGRSQMAFTSDIGMQEIGVAALQAKAQKRLDGAKSRGLPTDAKTWQDALTDEERAELEARQSKIASTRNAMEMQQRIVSDAGSIARPKAINLSGKKTNALLDGGQAAVSGGVGAAADWFTGAVQRASKAAERLGETVDDEGRKAARRLETIDRTDDELARLDIEKNKQGTEKELALIEQRRQIELRELEESGLWKGDQLEEMKGKVNAQAAIEAEIAKRGDVSHAVTSSGTLRGDLAAQQLGGQSIDDKQWETQKQMLKRLESIDGKKSGMTVGV